MSKTNAPTVHGAHKSSHFARLKPLQYSRLNYTTFTASHALRLKA
jgi:hypothetical protein